MKLKPKRIAPSIASVLLTTSSIAFAQGTPTHSVKTGYAPVIALRMYYEIHGLGEPLLLIHGGVVGIMADDALPATALPFLRPGGHK